MPHVSTFPPLGSDAGTFSMGEEESDAAFLVAYEHVAADDIDVLRMCESTPGGEAESDLLRCEQWHQNMRCAVHRCMERCEQCMIGYCVCYSLPVTAPRSEFPRHVCGDCVAALRPHAATPEPYSPSDVPSTSSSDEDVPSTPGRCHGMCQSCHRRRCSIVYGHDSPTAMTIRPCQCNDCGLADLQRIIEQRRQTTVMERRNTEIIRD